MISNETINELKELNELTQKADKLKEKLKKILNNELDAEYIRLMNVDNDSVVIYLSYNEEQENITEIASKLGYELENTFKSSNGLIYRLIPKK